MGKAKDLKLSLRNKSLILPYANGSCVRHFLFPQLNLYVIGENTTYITGLL